MVKKKKGIALENFDNKALVDRYNKLSRILSDHCNYEASDGTEINMMGLLYHIEKKARHLPNEEKQLLFDRQPKYTRLRNVLSRIKLKLKREVGSDYEGVLEVRKAEVLEMFGRHFSPAEIHRTLVKDSGLPIDFKAVQRFALKHRVEIEKKQIDWSKDHASVGIAKKRTRLEELDSMLRLLKQAIERTSADKQKVPFIKEARGLLEQARKEVEGNHIKLDIHGHIDINATIESARGVEQMYAEINWMNLLVARISARMRVNPLLLNYQLTNSWYAKQTGIERSKSLMDEEVDYPSKILLGIGWDELKDRAVKKEEDYKKLKEKYTEAIEIEASDDEKAAAQRIRAQLKLNMQKKRDALDGAKNRINGIK